MVATPQTFVATTIGRVAIPKLADTLVRTGADKFIKLYGQKAFEAVLGTAIGARAYSQTEEYISEYINHIDNGGDENSFVPKGSMPTATRAEQMDAMMAVPDITHKSVPVETGEGLYIGDRGQKEKERERIAAEERERMKGAPAPKVETGWKESFPDQSGELIDSSPPPSQPEPIEIPQESFPDQSEEFNKSQIFYSKKDDISKQTKELVPEKPEFGKLTKTEKQTAKALKEGKSDFYSRAVESIKNAKPDKLTKTKWKSYIQSTKDEMDYLGLTEFLKGNESITKKELLKFVEKKDIAPNITVRSIPKDEMNTMYEGYSLGGDTADTQEHIVFQIGKDDAEVGQLFKSGHFDTEYGTGNFAHARVQVGYDPLEGEMIERLRDLDIKPEEIEKAFKNTLIIDEIQSDWLQKGQDKGFVSDFEIVPGKNLLEYLKNNNIEYRISGKGKYTRDIEMQVKPGVWEDEPGFDPLNEGMDYIFNKNEKSLKFIYDPEEETKYSTPEEFLQKAYGIVPDFPVKESKKWVELVLNKLIEKAVLDGRDSIAITNGQIQANRYDAMGKEEKQGLKKFYDEIVFKQLEKIADKYNVELERIDITEGEAPKELQDAHLDNQIKRAQDDGFVLKKVNLQFLWDRTRDTDIPGHAALYSDRGVGQGANYIEDYLNELVGRPFSPAGMERSGTVSGAGSGLDKWNEIKNNEVYIWIKEQDISRDKIGWELPIVPVKDAYTTVVPTREAQQHFETLSNQDLEIYSLYLKGIEPPQGEEIHPEQLIKMKLPKKLQKERLSKPIKLTKAKQQTDRLFA